MDIENDAELSAIFNSLSDHQNHALGSVVGACIGDSIGSYLEFVDNITSEKVEKALTMPGGGTFNLAPGQVTDDSEMAISLAKALSDVPGVLSLDRITAFYANWINSKPFDKGITTGLALDHLQDYISKSKPLEGIYEECIKKSMHNVDSESNGGLMRISPLAVFCSLFKNEDDIYKAVEMEQKITHPKKEVIDASFLYCIGIIHLIHNKGDSSKLLEKIKEVKKRRNIILPEYIEKVEKRSYMDAKHKIGWMKIAWNYSFNLTLTSQHKDFLSAIKFTIQAGGDTDTNAAIVGGLLGAKYGLKRLYKDHPKMVLSFWNCDVTKSPTPRRSFFNPRNIYDSTLSIIENCREKLNLAEKISEEQKYLELNIFKAEHETKISPQNSETTFSKQKEQSINLSSSLSSMPKIEIINQNQYLESNKSEDDNGMSKSVDLSQKKLNPPKDSKHDQILVDVTIFYYDDAFKIEKFSPNKSLYELMQELYKRNHVKGDHQDHIFMINEGDKNLYKNMDQHLNEFDLKNVEIRVTKAIS